VYTFTKFHDKRIANVGVGVSIRVGAVECQLYGQPRSPKIRLPVRCLYFLRSDRLATFWPGEYCMAMTLKFELGRHFFQSCTYPLSFIVLSFIVRKLSCLLTNTQTNKQTDSIGNIHIAPPCSAGGKSTACLLTVRYPRVARMVEKASTRIYKKLDGNISKYIRGVSRMSTTAHA